MDLAFGPKDGNDVIYGAAVLPLVDLALQVPICRLQVRAGTLITRTTAMWAVYPLCPKEVDELLNKFFRVVENHSHYEGPDPSYLTECGFRLDLDPGWSKPFFQDQTLQNFAKIKF